MSKSASGIDDLALQRIRRKKPDVTAELFRELSESLQRFRSSPRFLFFQHMTVREFFGPDSDADEVVQELSFSDLIRLGSEGLCDLEAVRAVDLSRFAQILNQLVEGSEETEDSGIDTNPADLSELIDIPAEHARGMVGRGTLEDSDVPVYGSIEAEARLSNGFERIRTSASRAEIEQKKVSNFWPTDLGRAPFLEALTFRELLSLNVDDLLKKRSFGNRKIHGLLLTISSVLAAYKEAGLENFELDPLNAEPSSEPPKESPPTPSNVVSSLPLPSLSDDYPTFVQLAYRGLVEFVTSDPSCPEVLGRICRGLLYAAPPEQVLQELMVDAEDRSTFEFDADQISDALVLQVVEREAPDLVSSWRHLLASAAVAEKIFLDEVPPDPAAAALHKAVCRCILRALGAQPPADSTGEILSQAWTCNPRAFAVLVDSLIARLPLSDQVLREDLTALLPHVPVEDVIQFLEARISFSQGTSEWSTNK